MSSSPQIKTTCHPERSEGSQCDVLVKPGSLDRAAAIELLRHASLDELLSTATTLRAKGKGNGITFSKKVFIPVTTLCRDYCGYCTFRKDPGQPGAHFMTPDEVLALAEQGSRAGCKEALFSLGDQPERIFPEAREFLDRAGFKRTLDYVAATKVKRVHMMAGNASRKDAEAEASYRRAIAYAAPILAERGVDLVLEPINTRNMPDYFLNDFAYTSALIGSLGLPNLKLQFDVYHRQILHGDVTMAFRALQPIVGHVQVASVPSRHESDGEELNFPYLFAEFDRLGYDGYIGCEYDPRAGTLEGLAWHKPYRRV